jgi:ribonuclease-3
VTRHAALEKRIGYRFKDQALLTQALTHRSFGSPHNERLEFLGDCVLGCAVAEALFQRFPAMPEGKLTRARSSLVRESSLAGVALDLGLAKFLRLDEAAAMNNGAERPSILADSLEALYGAVFLDGGYPAARDAIARTFGDALAQINPDAVAKDAKTSLQEFLQARRKAMPEYRLVSSHGPKQRLTFEVECVVDDLKSEGSGSSRQRAEQQAAAALLRQLEGQRRE